MRVDTGRVRLLGGRAAWEVPLRETDRLLAMLKHGPGTMMRRWAEAAHLLPHGALAPTVRCSPLTEGNPLKIDDLFLEILDTEIKSGSTVFLSGEPGIGKTSLTKSLAKMNRSKHFVVSVNLLADKADLTGGRLLPTPDGKSFEQKFFAHHRVREAVAYANENPHSTVFLVLDEINRTTPDVTSGALSISTERELGDQELPDNVIIIVTGNTKGNVTALDDASLSRFAVYQVEPDATTLIAYLDSREGGNKPMNIWCKEALLQNPEAVFEKSAPTSFSVVDGDDDDDDTQNATFSALMEAGDEMLQLTTPRTIEGMSNWLDKASNELLMKLFQTPTQIGDRTVTKLHEAIEAHVGNTTFATILIGKISAALSSGQGKAPVGPSVPKPGCWGPLKAAATHSDLDDLIGTLNDNDKSGALVYALHDTSDNTSIIEQLLANGAAPTTDDNRVVVDMLRTDGFDTGNLNVIMNSSATSVEGIRQLASALGKA